jgi:hypothetical protein
MTRCAARLSSVCGAVLLASCVAGSATADGPSTNPSTTTPAASLFVSPSGRDSGACTRAAPCATFTRAYQRAAAGAVVEVAPGHYVEQDIDAPSKPRGPNVVFRPTAGGHVTVDNLEVTNGSHIEFRDFSVPGDTYTRPGAQYITYRRITMGVFLIRGADHISYVDSNVGPNDSRDGMNWITAAYDKDDPATNILLDRVRIHDFTKHSEGSHVDCVGIDDVDGLVIRNSRIWHCEHFAIIFGNDNSTDRAARNVLLENNFLDCCVSGYYAIGFGGVDGRMLIRFNSSDQPFGWLNGTDLVPAGLVTLDSNVVDYNNPSNCSRATWRFNVVGSGSACGGGGLVGALGFRAPPVDLHLVTRAAARGRGNPSAFPPRDIDGQLRASGRRPDAGADQVRSP